MKFSHFLKSDIINEPNFLDLVDLVIGEDASGVTLVPVLPDGALHLLLHGCPLRVLVGDIHQDSALTRAARRRLPQDRGVS